jgi:hypothetical protein
MLSIKERSWLKFPYIKNCFPVLKIAILTRPDYRSPRILADSLQSRLQRQGIETEIFYDLNFMTRMVSLKESKLSFHFWLIEKLRYFSKDTAVLKALKKFDLIIISECSPAVFLKKMYNVEKLKRKVKKPVGLYEVYYLENAPTQIRFLKKSKNPLLERFDFHLSVSDVTEVKQLHCDKWFPIGIESRSWGLNPIPKKEMIAIIDFGQAGFEEYHSIQIRALKKAGIKYISLDGTYTIDAIRNIYKVGAIFFIQFPEAFGISILECLCCGCQIFTPHSCWPMSWRLNENPEVHGEGTLPGCFTVYNTEEQLMEELLAFKENYDLVQSPKRVFEIFLEHYLYFYLGNENEMKRLLQKIQPANVDD